MSSPLHFADGDLGGSLSVGWFTPTAPRGLATWLSLSYVHCMEPGDGLITQKALNSELRDDLSMFESSHEALVHFSLVWLVSSFMTRVDWKRYVVDKEELVKDAAWYGRRILPIAVLQTANVVMNTTSLKYIGAGFNSIIGVLCPVLTALMSAALGQSFKSLAWFGIVIAIAGDAVISREGLRNLTLEGQSASLALLGMSLGIGALFARSIRSVLMDCQMNQYESDQDCPKLSPTKLLALTSPAVFFFGLVLTLVLEGLEPFFQIPYMNFEAATMHLGVEEPH
ncbi:unnamed protein product [Cladocopium goreaui]|uniref:GDP-mannose transporter GONST5 n=2 Tax=Cladocopium goreaui TaxID=2562237 RepID=A0A9P1GLQ0_9DINO|nr:unnamed protein product [Cladocopium goreaui]